MNRNAFFKFAKTTSDFITVLSKLLSSREQQNAKLINQTDNFIKETNAIFERSKKEKNYSNSINSIGAAGGFIASIGAIVAGYYAKKAHNESVKQTNTMIEQTKIQQFEWGFESLKKYFGFTKINRRLSKSYETQAEEYKEAKHSIFMISHSGQRAMDPKRNDGKKGENPVKEVIDKK